MALDDLLGGAIGSVWITGLACPNPQHHGMLQQQAMQEQMLAMQRGMQQQREPTPEEQARYNRAMMNAIPAIAHPGVEPIEDRWPPREAPASVVAVLRERDWLFWGWLLAGAFALFVRWGLTH